jgi:hypothetical protein
VPARVPDDLATEAKNASARLGVPVWAVHAACLRQALPLLTEEEAAAELEPASMEALKRRRAAEKARDLLRDA